MSNRTECELPQLDLTTMERTARELGYTVLHNADAYGYWQGERSLGRCDLVIKNPNTSDKFDIGFRTTKERGTHMVMDTHGGVVNRELSKIMPAYYEAMILARQRRFRVTQHTENQQQIVLRIE